LGNLALPAPEPCRIIGVVGDTLITGLDGPPRAIAYFSSYVAKEILVVRTSVDPLSVAAQMQRAVAETDPEQPLSGIRSMEDVMSRSLSRRNFAAVLLVLFAGLGLLLAALGLYGLMAYSVARRTQEIGVRMALGAEPASIFRMVLAQALWITAIGAAAGIIAAVGATQLMASLLFGISAADPLSYAMGCGLLLIVSGMASVIPAYRAIRVDPLVALRYE
jgi:putative ABC transport system permease protein